METKDREDQPQTSSEKDKEALHEMNERFSYAIGYWKDNRDRYKEDLEFLAGNQWPESIKQDREGDGQPCLVVDKLNQYVRQVVNDSRQNRPSIKVRPVDDNADIETADIMSGLVKHIEDRSDASAAYDCAIDTAVRGGFGFIRVLTEYEHENTFNQEIVIERVRNPLSILIDPDCKKADFSDMTYAFVIDDISCEAFEEQYPDYDEESTPDFNGDGLEWSAGDEKKRIAEYWEVVTKPKAIHLLESGDTVDDSMYQQAIAEGIFVPAIVDTRTIDTKVVMVSKVHGNGYLEEPKEWLGKYIPIVPVVGNEIDIEGKVSYVGLIHSAKDAQRLYNYSRSAFAERVALAPKAPFIAAAGQVEQYPEWDDANRTNYSVLRYDPVSLDGTVVGAPQRQPASDVPVGFSQDMQLSEHDIQASLGMYSASLGQPSNEKSGRAIMARQREGDTSTFHFHDNLNRAIRYLGRILIDLSPKTYDSRRTIRILGDDGSTKNVQLDPTLQAPKQKIGSKSIYNIGMGIYDVTVTAGASYTTKRQEAADAMIELSRANPQLWQTHGDLIVKSQDWPLAEEFAKRSKKLLPPNLATDDSQEDEEIPPQVEAVMNQAEHAIQQRDQQIQMLMAKVQELEQSANTSNIENHVAVAEIELKGREVAVRETEVEIKAYEAETDRLKIEADLHKAKIQAELKIAEKAVDSMVSSVEVVDNNHAMY